MINVRKKILFLFLAIFCYVSFPARAQRWMENLDRGTVAVKLGGDSVYIGWRMLGTDPSDIGFNLYRLPGNVTGNKTVNNTELETGNTPGNQTVNKSGYVVRNNAGKMGDKTLNLSVRLNDLPITESTNFIDIYNSSNHPLLYFVRPVINGKELEASDTAEAWATNYLSIPLQSPEGHFPNDVSVGDLDGDGDYELVVHQAGRSADNARAGMTSEPILEAYDLDGTFLWRINLGVNIREGAHYTQFMVYDLDGDGKAEVACKTADGTIDGRGKVIGDPNAVYRNPEGTTLKGVRRDGSEYERNMSGLILSGPEYLTVFDGLTGAELATKDYIPQRHPDTNSPTPEQIRETWGDDYGNRMDRFLACIAYLDGERPSLVMCRGYYTRTVIAAWNYRDNDLKPIWVFDSDDGTPGNEIYRGQGNHNISVGDVDNDGRDEIIYGACAIDDNGKGLYSTGLGHGDAMHFSDLDPDNPGLEVFNIQERFSDAGANFREAGTGKILWKKPSVTADQFGRDRGEGPGRGNSFNIDPRYRGSECWVAGAGIRGLFSAKGELISETNPRSCNFAVWWDADLTRELLDRNIISKWNWEKSVQEPIFIAEECRSINGTKATPNLSADILGDWREEVIWRTEDNSELRIYTTTIPAKNRFYTFMHDPVYRLAIAWQNVAYNQPPHTSFYIGEDMNPQPRYPIRVTGK
jgi:rhamnogalacturonan endolyase